MFEIYCETGCTYIICCIIAKKPLSRVFVILDDFGSICSCNKESERITQTKNKIGQCVALVKHMWWRVCAQNISQTTHKVIEFFYYTLYFNTPQSCNQWRSNNNFAMGG